VRTVLHNERACKYKYVCSLKSSAAKVQRVGGAAVCIALCPSPHMGAVGKNRRSPPKREYG